MANEITASTSLTLNNGSVSTGDSSSKTISQTTPRFMAGVQNIGTTQEQISLISDISTPGLASFKNMDATNYVEIGVVVSGTFYPLVKLKPGDPAAQFRLATGTFYARANTAAVDLQYTILAD